MAQDTYERAHDWLWNNGYRGVLESPEEHEPGELREGLNAFLAAHPDVEYV